MDPVFAAVEQVIADAPAETVPALLGELERLKTILWVKMMMNGHGQGSGQAPQEETLLTIPEVAKQLNVPASHAYELARQGKLRAVKLGKYVRVSSGALAAYKATLGRP